MNNDNKASQPKVASIADDAQFSAEIWKWHRSLIFGGATAQAAEKALIAYLDSKLRAPADQSASVGEVTAMPGTSGFTMAVFKAFDVPVGAKLYASPGAAQSADKPSASIEGCGTNWGAVMDLIANELEKKSNLNEISQFTALCEEFYRLRALTVSASAADGSEATS